jgi:3-oxoacyl-[acyl-carrier protein] reductase
MDLGITGKVALVFGASRGLGKAVAERLGHEGCRVIAVARSSGALQEASEGMRALGLEVTTMCCDVSDKNAIHDLILGARSAVGDPEIVVYNNGGPADSSFGEATDDEFMGAYTQQIMGFSWVVREVVPAMKRRNWGRIVTLGSMASKEPHREMPLVLHNIMRPAALGLSKTLSVDLGKFGITVNTIGTGLIDGGDDNSFRKTCRALAEKQGIAFEELLASRLATVPVGRGGRPDEVGSLCAYLCSECAGFLTGQTIILDGGKTRTLF